MLPLAAAPAYTHSDMFCSGSGRGFSLSVIIQELTVTYFSTGPALLLLSLSVALRTPCALLLFFVLGIFFLSTSSICLLFARRYFRLPPSLSKRAPPSPVCLSSIPKRVFCGFLLCRGSTQSQPLPFTFRCHTPACLLFSFFFPRPSSLGHACLSASALMDLSVGRLQQVSALASVTRDDLHLIRGWR